MAINVCARRMRQPEEDGSHASAAGADIEGAKHAADLQGKSHPASLTGRSAGIYVHGGVR